MADPEYEPRPKGIKSPNELRIQLYALLRWLEKGIRPMFMLIRARLLPLFVWLWERCVTPTLVGLCGIAFILVLSYYILRENDKWNDRVTYIGFAITVYGFGMTLWQLALTKSASVAAEKASNEATDRMTVEHYKFCIVSAGKLLLSATHHVASKEWKRAILRLHDVSDRLMDVDGLRDQVDKRWQHDALTLRAWAKEFRDGKETKALEFNVSRWEDDSVAIKHALDSELRKLSFGGDGDVIK